MSEFVKTNRVGIHSHVLGYDNLVDIKGQKNCKNALIQIKTFLKRNNSNQIIILRGPSGSGKTTLIKNVFKDEFLINFIDSMEFNSFTVSPFEFLTQAFRQSVKLKVKETLKIIEGEVTSLNSTKLGLKTLDMESIFEIGDNMTHQINKEKIVVGDVIRIIKERGKIIKLGINSAKMEPDLLGDLNPIPCPEGELFKTVEEVQDLTLHDIDCLNNRTHGYLNLYNGETGEISQEIRNEVNEKIKKWVLEEKVLIERGVLVIYNSHLLSSKILSVINKLSEKSLSPLIFLVENLSNENLSTEILNNALVLEILEMKFEDYKNIFSARLDFFNFEKNNEVLDFFSKLAEAKGINYAINILDMCISKAQSFGLNLLEMNEINKIVNLFSLPEIDRKSVV